ncbi:MAG: aspartate dehydrogenase [Nitrososphaerales archaeon]|jgi:aspartate dehydrogenase|nr:aspartate dehydrogenase [Nitrososphaeraceae archaeon]HSE99496.1 aspartate dehydrogenase [Nitrososphaeraceae archaeon]
MKKNISIIGCGAIGSELALSVDRMMIENVNISSFLDIKLENAEILKSKLSNNNPIVFNNFSDYIKSDTFKDVDLVVEAASQNALTSYLNPIILLKKDILVMSVGAFANPDFFSQVIKNVEKNDINLYVPSGAIAGIDAIKSVRSSISYVTLTTTKNPNSLKDSPFFKKTNLTVDSIKKRTLLFEGSAIEAVQNFPANVNVAALLGLAGIGVEKTKVNVIADPSLRINKHEIKVIGKFGELIVRVKNVPSPTNPKTSYLAILSVIESLRSITTKGVKYGT